MVINSAIDKKELIDLIDKLPKDKYREAAKILWEMSLPEIEPTEEEKKSIEEARERFLKGEYHTLDEFLKELGDDEE